MATAFTSSTIMLKMVHHPLINGYLINQNLLDKQENSISSVIGMFFYLAFFICFILILNLIWSTHRQKIFIFHSDLVFLLFSIHKQMVYLDAFVYDVFVNDFWNYIDDGNMGNVNVFYQHNHVINGVSSLDMFYMNGHTPLYMDTVWNSIHLKKKKE